MTSVPGFLTKTFEIFSSTEFSDCCGWGPNGDTIIIRKIEQFSKQVLPRYFKHSNFQSFVRQLNMYDFHKTVQDPNHGEFQHQYFRQNKPELLVYIKRKANNRGVETIKKLSGKGFGSGSTDNIVGSDAASLDESLTKLLPDDLAQEADAVLQELEQQKSLRSEFEKRMEAKLSKLEGENQVLKRLFVESHQKNLVMQERMEKVLRTLYAVFMGSSSGRAIGGRIPNMLLSDLKAYGNGGGFQSRAIMDGNADVDDFDAADKADADLDEFGLDRFPSIDFGANGQPTAAGDVGTSSDPSAYSYSLLNNKMNGAELASISSFDQCAARVSAPLKHLASFDSTYFSPPMESFNSTNNNNNITSSSSNNNKNGIAPYSDFVSDRVTLLADSSADEMEALNVPTSSSSFNDPQLGKRKSEAISEKSHHDIQMDKRTKPLEGADTTLPDQPASTLRQSLDSEDTEQFIHLLSRNQNTTLNRLDSLEMTLASLLENIDNYDAPEGSSAVGGVETMGDVPPS